MIARMWHGRIPANKTEAYHEFLKASGLRDYRETPGNKAVYLLKQEDGPITHIYTLSFWENLEAIKRFAGEHYTKARYYPEDKEFLLEFEPLVQHFDVLEHF